MSDNIRFPVQCSEDLPDPQTAIPTGQLVPFTTTSTSPNTETETLEADIQTENSHQPEAPPSQDPPFYNAQNAWGDAQAIDSIVLKGHGDGKIKATGLVAALEPGGVFQAAMYGHLTIHKGSNPSAVKEPKRTNKYKITDSQKVPGIEHLDVVSDFLGVDGRRLGRAFDIHDGTLEQIHSDYKADGQQEINYRILLKWMQNCKYPTVHKLAQTLSAIGRGDLADELRNG